MVAARAVGPGVIGDEDEEEGLKPAAGAGLRLLPTSSPRPAMETNGWISSLQAQKQIAGRFQ